jgi:hypothetical protein
MNVNTAVVLTRFLAALWVFAWMCVHQFWGWSGHGCFWAAAVGAFCLIVESEKH